MFLYFTLSIDINCSRKQQNLEIKRELHSLRLDRSLVCVELSDEQAEYLILSTKLENADLLSLASHQSMETVYSHLPDKRACSLSISEKKVHPTTIFRVINDKFSHPARDFSCNK
jgi:hypothetical protein